MTAELILFDYQQQAVDAAMVLPGPAQRLCLYYKTGAGKSLTALSCLSAWGHSSALVVAPPATHQQWREFAAAVGIQVETMSHAKFRMKDTLLSRTQAVIADEMHLFGGHDGKGWRKLDKLALHLQAPLVLASATPNYNDAERVYCIQHILDPLSCRGGYLEFLYKNCITEENFFGRIPKVVGFHHHKDAAAYLASLPGVEYLPDNLTYSITDHQVSSAMPLELDLFGLYRRKHKLIASTMEDKHARISLALIDDDQSLRGPVFDQILAIVRSSPTPVLVFANHATVAQAAGVSLHRAKVSHAVVHGSMTTAVKQGLLDGFKRGGFDVLVGTATLATGTDGLDRVCDTLIILDDTEDDAMRRQLIGRIMPRGISPAMHTKTVHRLVL
jgi:superfamily II DNA or RNA helicase